jgi:hypothetical protein
VTCFIEPGRTFQEPTVEGPVIGRKAALLGAGGAVSECLYCAISFMSGALCSCFS